MRIAVVVGTVALALLASSACLGPPDAGRAEPASSAPSEWLVVHAFLDIPPGDDDIESRLAETPTTQLMIRKSDLVEARAYLEPGEPFSFITVVSPAREDTLLVVEPMALLTAAMRSDFAVDGDFMKRGR